MNSEWINVKFEDICINKNVTVKNPEEAGIERFVGLEHLEPEELEISSWGLIAEGISFTRRFLPGQVLFGKRRSYQKKASVASFEGVCSGDILVFEAKKDVLISELLPYIVQNDKFFDYSVGTSSGSLSPRTSWKHLSKYQLRIPKNIENQEKIFFQLLKLEEALKLKRKLVESTKTYRKKLMHQLMTRGIGHTDFKQTELGEIPVQWKCTKLSDVFSINTRTINPQLIDDRLVHYSLPAFDEFKEPKVEEGNLIKSNKIHIEKNTILVSKLNPRISRVWKVMVDKYPGIKVSSTEFINYVPKEECCLDFFFFYFSSETFQQELLIRESGTTGSRKRVSPKDTLAITVPLPSLKEQGEISEILLMVDQQIENYEKEHNQLKELKKAFLRQLF